MRTAVAVAVFLCCLLGMAPASEARAPRLLRAEYEHFVVRPHRIAYASDGSGFLLHLRWSEWSHRGARATGIDRLYFYDPRHPNRPMHYRRTTVEATRVRHGRFTRLSIVDGHAGRLTTQRWRLTPWGPGRWVWLSGT